MQPHAIRTGAGPRRSRSTLRKHVGRAEGRAPAVLPGRLRHARCSTPLLRAWPRRRLASAPHFFSPSSHSIAGASVSSTALKISCVSSRNSWNPGCIPLDEAWAWRARLSPATRSVSVKIHCKQGGTMPRRSRSSRHARLRRRADSTPEVRHGHLRRACCTLTSLRPRRRQHTSSAPRVVDSTCGALNFPATSAQPCSFGASGKQSSGAGLMAARCIQRPRGHRRTVPDGLHCPRLSASAPTSTTTTEAPGRSTGKTWRRG
mmetsp:Transcript_57842/g.179723  ORF Transcript_57842/g.179723 Transcript_57842/m.179723 type:complete len:261 (-) Transcript_57842:372-1154(-)